MRQTSFPDIVKVVTLAALAYLVVSVSFTSDVTLFFHEGHGVEELSLALLILGIVLWFWLAGEHRFREWQIPAALILMLMREMDFDKRFTEHGLLKLTTYTREAPVMTKLIGAAVILFTLWAGFRILRRNLPLWWARLRMGAGDAWMLGAACVAAILAKTLDGLGRKLASVGVYIPEQVNTIAGQSEEVLEAFCYYLVVLAIARLAVPAIRQAAGLSPMVPAE